MDSTISNTFFLEPIHSFPPSLKVVCYSKNGSDTYAIDNTGRAILNGTHTNTAYIGKKNGNFRLLPKGISFSGAAIEFSESNFFKSLVSKTQKSTLYVFPNADSEPKIEVLDLNKKEHFLEIKEITNSSKEEMSLEEEGGITDQTAYWFYSSQNQVSGETDSIRWSDFSFPIKNLYFVHNPQFSPSRSEETYGYLAFTSCIDRTMSMFINASMETIEVWKLSNSTPHADCVFSLEWRGQSFPSYTFSEDCFIYNSEESNSLVFCKLNDLPTCSQNQCKLSTNGRLIDLLWHKKYVYVITHNDTIQVSLFHYINKNLSFVKSLTLVENKALDMGTTLAKRNSLFQFKLKGREGVFIEEQDGSSILNVWKLPSE